MKKIKSRNSVKKFAEVRSRESAVAIKPNSTSSQKKGSHKNPKTIIGWREWIGLTELGLPPIKAKIDTGARTSALHAFKIRPFESKGIQYVEFYIHPIQRHRHPEIRCQAPIHDQRFVTSSTGHRRLRFVIMTTAVIGNQVQRIELTLANRDQLGFRMLIGREALKKHFLIDPGRSYCAGKFDENILERKK